jgi:hypothetical protein
VNLKQLGAWSMDGTAAHNMYWFEYLMRRALEHARTLRQDIEAIPDLDVAATDRKARLLAEAEESTALLRLGADLLVAVALQPTAGRQRLSGELLMRYQEVVDWAEEIRRSGELGSGALKPEVVAQQRAKVRSLREDADAFLARKGPSRVEAVPEDAAPSANQVRLGFETSMSSGDPGQAQGQPLPTAAGLGFGAQTTNSEQRTANSEQRSPFHWPLEFPEVFVDIDVLGQPCGFDAVVGNPPFLGGSKITGEMGTDYREYLVEALAGAARGSADLCAYFFLRAFENLRPGGNLALLATNTIAQGAPARSASTTWWKRAPSLPVPYAAGSGLAMRTSRSPSSGYTRASGQTVAAWTARPLPASRPTLPHRRKLSAVHAL